MNTIRTIIAILTFLAPAGLRAAEPTVDSLGNIIIKLDDSPYQSYGGIPDSGDEPGIGLALSGGGARGLAHIGVLNVLTRENIKISFIAGVSMGGVIGGLYSSGYSPEEIEKITRGLNWGRLFSPSPLRNSLLGTQKGLSEKTLISIRFDDWKPVIPRAITSGQNLSQFLETLTVRGGIRSSISFDYLEPPLRIICTDLSTGEQVVLSSGSLSEAMRATMAVPVAFTPAEIDRKFLVDGGLVDPVPVDVVRMMGDFPVVAVNTTSDLLSAESVDNLIEIADQTTTIMSMHRKQEALLAADLIIAPDMAGRVSTDFDNIDSIIEAGEKAAEEALPRIRQLLSRNIISTDSSESYIITGWKIIGLSAMPMTFFKTTFENSPRMSREMIEYNLHTALSTGYLEDAKAVLIPSDSGYFIEYRLADNPRIKEIVFEGDKPYDDRELYSLLENKEGMVLNSKTALADRKELETKFIGDGYSLARVSTVFDHSFERLVFKIDEGRINRISVEGNHRTKDWAIRRHIPFDPGDIYMQKSAHGGVTDLYGTGLFETARFLAVPDTQGVTLLVRVTEKPHYILRSGARYDNEYGSKVFFDLVDDNLLGDGQELFTSTTAGEKQRSVSLNFKADRIFKTLFTYILTFDYSEFKRNHYLEHEYIGHFRQFSHGGELSIGRQIPRLGTVGFVGQFRRYRWDEPDKTSRQEFDKTSIGFRSKVDTRDSFDLPSTGKYHLFQMEFSGDLSDDKPAYSRLFTSLESYYPLTERLNLHPELSLGLSSNFLPYFDKFSLGGQTGFLGLYEDEILGDKLFSGSIDFRYRAFGPVYLLARYNAGNIWSKLENIRLSELRSGAGAGILIKSPIGPVSGWYGRTAKGLNAFYLSVGYDW